MKVPLMFKRFAFQQNRILKSAYNSAQTPKDKAILGAKIMALYTAMGELTESGKEGVRAGVKGENPITAIAERGEEGPTDAKMVNRAIDDISNAYAFGLVGEIFGQAGSGVKGKLSQLCIGSGYWGFVWIS